MNNSPDLAPKKRLRIYCEAAAKINFACHQNSYALLRDLRIENLTEGETLENLLITAEADPGFLKPKVWQVDRIEPHGALPIRNRDLDLNGQFLLDLSEAVRGTFNVKVEKDGELLAEHSQSIELLAANEWGGAGYMPELLAAFCTPNDPAVDQVLRNAAKVLRSAGKSKAIDGYQSGSRQRVWEIASAVYSAIANLGIAYAVPPASFETNGQKIRPPGQILKGGVATCLDNAMLFAAAFEQAGLNPIIALLKGHALVGVWLQPEKLSSIIVDEAEVLRKRSQLKELVLIESTLCTSRPSPPFSLAVKAATDTLAAENDEDFVAAVDIGRARAHRISPLGLRHDSGSILPGGDESVGLELALEEAPALPDFDNEVEEVKPTTSQGRIDRWQRKLLDLSARNPLLNHRSTKSSIKLFCPDPGLLEDRLAAGAKISVVSVPEAPTQEQDRSIHLQRTGEQLDEAYARDALNQRQVLVNLPKSELDRRMVQIYRKTQSALQEGGANTLYLALGFLLWKRDEKDEKRFRAPLILLPITLQRQSVRSGVKMLAHDDEPRFNTTLLELLRKDYGIDIRGLDGTLPADESGVDVAGIWNKVRRDVKDSAGFEVVEDIVLGHFSFAKFLMWKDLIDRTDELRKNTVVRHLIDTPRDAYRSNVAFVNREDIDTDFKPADFLAPLPADSSQMAAIASADQGKDFILIGPPGTGKSQTISNLIAHLLGKGRKVLFVSEKTAALDVVYRRLDNIGLGRFCLELHSNKARKADVLKQLKEAWSAGLSRSEEEWKKEAGRLEQLRDRLNSVVHHLHKKHSNGLTAHYAIGIKVRDEAIAQRVQLNWTLWKQHSEEEIDRMRDSVGLLQVQARSVGGISDSPFHLISHGDWSPKWEREILGTATQLAESARETDKSCTSFCSMLEIDLPDHSLARLESLEELADVLTQAYRKQTGYALGADGQDQIDALEEAVSHLKAYSAVQARLSCPYEPMAWRKLDGIALGAQWKESEGNWALKRALKQRAIRKQMVEGGALGKPNPMEDCAVLAVLRKEGEAIDRLDHQLDLLRDWKSHDTDPTVAENMQAIAARLRAAVASLVDTPQLLIEVRTKIRNLLDDGNDLLAPDAPIGKAALNFIQALKRLKETITCFENLAGREVRDQHAEGNRDLKLLRESAELIVERHAELNQWCGWQRRRNEALDIDLGEFVAAIESGKIPIDEIPETFEAAYCSWWTENLLAEDEVLRTFSNAEHTDAIEKFRQVDEAFMKSTAQYVAAQLSAGLPINSDVPRSSQWGLLKREITKRARHKAVRQLLQDAPEAVTRLAPCLMMSPLSVAQYLSAEQSLFDVVIFDEASQITVWDAVGAIARGKQVIVAGDPKQMPPTNFFGRADDDADGDVDYEGDLESILDELRSSNLPELVLNLHYRSRRESLITFSNNRYYDNGLVTFPAPVHPDHGVQLVRPVGVYDRGKSRTNKGEARAIVAEIVRRLTSKKPSERQRTIGVVTFNSEQQSLIEDLLDIARSKNTEIEWAFAEDCTEPVFVKNLETVQGDERDVILFSITYAPDNAGNMYMNFGPLNREGGERRLNVAITRARSEMVVFSSLHPDKIDLSRTSARAVADLKHFLEFAERGPDALGAAVHGSVGDFESPFESAVAAGLRDRGWTVHPQIGVSAFRVDLGVVHPDEPGAFLAGVECDGAMYHSSAYARERDKIRQAVLEGLGWTLFRVWSTDWWINKASALNKLDEQLKEHLEKDQAIRAKENDETPIVRVASFHGDTSLSGTEDNGRNQIVEASDFEESDPVQPEVDDDFYRRVSYVRSELVINTGYAQLGEMSPSRLVDSIREIVKVESPVHVEDVTRRITQAAGLHRAGARIQEVVRLAVAQASRKKKIIRKKDFLWMPDHGKVVVRDRSGSDFPHQDKKLERVAPEEIAQALFEVVERHFSLSTEDAVSEAARDLGFQRVTASMQKLLKKVLNKQIKSNELKSDGQLLSLPSEDGD